MTRNEILGRMSATLIAAVACWMLASLCASQGTCQSAPSDDLPMRGIRAVLGLPESGNPASVLAAATNPDWIIYFQSSDAEEVRAVREEADRRGLLGTRVVAEQGALSSIHLAHNLADEVQVAPAVLDQVVREEVFRVLRPEGIAILGDSRVTKPRPEGVDSWSHVYHGPDNNPQSTDQLARAPYRTQFLGGPLFSPMPEVTVAAGGRIFKACGHIAHKANQNPALNTLYCINAFNGSVLWTRPLSPGFMIHRNTMIATENQFYLADDKSCKLIDPATGQVRSEIVVPEGLSDGPVWKWMALQDGVLYALIGGPEIVVDTIRSSLRGIGHWPWGMWQGHDYSDPRTNFGFGRTFLAIDPATQKVLWSYRDDDYIDSRGVCMRNGRIYFCSPEKFVACLDVQRGEIAWKNSDESLLRAIGPNAPAQHYVTGYATTSYIKCDDRQIYFAGPQRARFVVASAEDGSLLWQKRQGNVQIVLREDGVYCAGPQLEDNEASAIYAYDGTPLGPLPIRRACTRATGSIDSVFYRTTGGTVRFHVPDRSAQHIAPMRPPCQDGVIISDGLLFWGPWMCGCQLSFYGHICLGPAEADPTPMTTAEPQWQPASDSPEQVAEFASGSEDWPAFQRDNWRSMFTRSAVPDNVQLAWQSQVVRESLPTAPVLAGGNVIVADRTGVVQALDAQGQPLWRVCTGGPIYYPPTLAEHRLYFGSADGHVYALEAATGRLLWSYRVAPQARRIPVYGRLISTWPVSAGVVVQQGVVYAAAGMAHYDGTYVVALDALTGKPIWVNDSSGQLSDQVDCGISLQGELQILDDQLQFLGGGPYLRAQYDLKTGTCLNPPRHEPTSQFETAFYPYYPSYAKYSSLHHTFADGRTLFYISSYDGSNPTRLKVLAPLAENPDAASPKPNQRAGAKPGRPAERPPVWQTGNTPLFTAFVVTPEVLLAAGPTESGNGGHVSAISLSDGNVLWRQSLESVPVKGGLALDAQQRIVVTLESGQMLCFVASP